MKISHWYGRLGNNIQQCAVGVMTAYKFETNFESIDHDIIKKFYYLNGERYDESESKFFYWEGPYQEVDIPSDFIYRSMRKTCKDYIFPQLRVPRVVVADDTLVIHIRSGDVFDKGVSNPSQYAPNPLYFYTTLLEGFNKAIVVTEPDSHNPVVQELKRHPKVTVQSLSVAEDFATLLAAKHLANSGVGTFAVAAALCSHKIENFYCSDIAISENLYYYLLVGTDVKVYLMELPNWIRPGEWKNSDEQRRMIIDYKI